MKKRNLKSLTLNKKAISKLEIKDSINGGYRASDQLTECRNNYCVSLYNSCPWVC